ncbi:MAG: DNA-protecting protein DprA [Candidatus Staskawiczbacteria bacterium CG10_big_fil_rev_8_21_14_0_10_38_10]|uniref:DNA-protecting protein DprA n=1 Tax=Candidatus Staskawiczbacteria bacterium CG10_big_fil_rev_8_21_14_0_10_38_10 TaxID=1974891 RepID=A0A2H9T131_9BACT|nr:MAG: DNA-protecting protein DprA [Candidatus Staskawiczbacteria bacterium CG10_big_fil_rev_8_21_14_0_10_38_10]
MTDIRKISISDKNYPKLLRKISDPPKILYFRGEIKPDELCFGIVGTRRNSSYGKQVALEVAKDLVESGLTIVSGLAPGIDTFAHQACVERQKRTIAILGTGLDPKSIYPQSNLDLSKRIIETGGCLISEYPPGTPGSKFSFPRRNRIIAGLSMGILVVEAKEKSGSLITADYAFKEKRKVFAVPGQIYSSNSKGPHKLINKGAKLIEDARDILKELNLPQLSIIGSFAEGKTDEEKIILEVLKEGALYIDKIIEGTKLSASLVSKTLALMEVSGRVKNLGGNIFAVEKI